MVNSIVVGPTASGKSTLCFKIVGMQVDATHRPTAAVDYMECVVNDRQLNVWDTPACVQDKIPEMAQGVLQDCDIVVVCYDGRREWSPIHIVKNVGEQKCILALTHPRAYNWATAKEMFDMSSTPFTSVPVVAAYSDADALISCILRMC